MKKFSIWVACAWCLFGAATAQTPEWKMVAGKIATPWAENVDPARPLPDYPRPQLVRKEWTNLNGLWDYALLPKGQPAPAAYQGKILVPFALESALSGVGKTIGKDSVLWYRTSFNLPASAKGKEVLLHLGAVDWETEVFVNGKKAGLHQGGFDPFSLVITPYLTKTGKQQISIRVWDPTDQGTQPRGKQVKNPEGIWYTPVTGIWQTVWLESVPKTYIASTRHTPDIDAQTLTFTADVRNTQPGDRLKVTAWDGQTRVAEQETGIASAAVLKISNPKLWSPTRPFLYDLKVSVVRNGKVLDQIGSYVAMRKISIAADKSGIQRMLLNNTFVFQYGPLDQGWWPDGLYTAPTDEALRFDIEKTRELGFNMIRKHIKVEPARWYYHCDRLGMLVWQDMPSGDLGNVWEPRPGLIGRGTEKQRTPESEQYYRTEWNRIIDALYNFPSIVVWTPFNEAWGQFKTVEITQWTMEKDPSRLVNSASGGNFFPTGHLMDLHNYPEPAMPDPGLFGARQAVVLGEFGGLGLPVPGHTWQQKDNWGYQTFRTPDEMFKKYASFTEQLESLIRKGLSAAVYTQTTDVEVEINGLMTYDRKVVKFPIDLMKARHSRLYQAFAGDVKSD